MVCKENIDNVIKILPDWSKTNDEREALNKEFIFDNFNSAFSFMTMIALKADQLNHHPEWSNVYNRVNITITTHDVKGMSDKDIEIGKFIDNAYLKFRN